MKNLIVLVSLTFFFSANAQKQLIIPRKIETFKKFNTLINEKIFESYTVDFNGDKKNDFICLTTISDSTVYMREYWISSDFKVIKRNTVGLADFYNWWFVNLDNDSIPELIYANGYSEGVDYGLYKQNFIIGKDSLLLYFEPIIKTKTGLFWCGPSEITGMYTRNTNNNIQILCSLDHTIKRGEVTYIERESVYPVFFFTGKLIDPLKVEDVQINNIKWLSIKSILSKTIK